MPKNRQNRPKTAKIAENYITERIIVEKLIPGGQALATLASGQKIFLWDALPGEIITRARLTKAKSHYLEAIALDREQPSSHRIAPRDPAFLATSPWQVLSYDYELEQKRALLQEIFRQHGLTANSTTSEPSAPTANPKSPIFIPPVLTDHRDFHYRNKMEYALYFDHDDQKIHLAFHARGSHRKLPITHSSLEHPAILARAQDIVADLNRTHADARRFQSLLLRCNQAGKVEGGLFENHQPRPHFPPLSDQILGHLYTYSPNGFFQINLPVYELALRTMQPHLSTAKVLDLYAGVGTIGLSLARDRDLTLVECDHAAYRELAANCQGTNARPVLAKSEEALDYLQPDQTVILDPPRAGCHPELIARLLAVTPPTILYLSCNPATQARDVRLLLDRYQITAVQPFNFFPRTPHLENLIVLTSTATPQHLSAPVTTSATPTNHSKE